MIGFSCNYRVEKCDSRKWYVIDDTRTIRLLSNEVNIIEIKEKDSSEWLEFIGICRKFIEFFGICQNILGIF